MKGAKGDAPLNTRRNPKITKAIIIGNIHQRLPRNTNFRSSNRISFIIYTEYNLPGISHTARNTSRHILSEISCDT